MSLPFILPPITPGSSTPIWNGSGFSIDNDTVKVLEYSVNDSGWVDSLTDFHEDTAGDNHFIDQASREYAKQQIQKNILTSNPVILEIGCSSGFMLNVMRDAFPQATLLGADVVKEPLVKLAAKMPNIPILRFDLLNCPLPAESVDVVVMLNVLEHIENDAAALRQVWRILKPGGVVILEVPAGPHLFDIYDKALMHFRRYSASQLKKLMVDIGFRIEKQSHLGFFIYPGFWLAKTRNKRFLSAPDSVQQQKVAANIQQTKNSVLLTKLMQFELFLGTYINYPVGIRCLMTGIKSASLN